MTKTNETMGLRMFLVELIGSRAGTSPVIEIVDDNAKSNVREATSFFYSNSSNSLNSNRRVKLCRWSSSEDLSSVADSKQRTLGPRPKRPQRGIRGTLKSSQSDSTILQIPRRCLSPGQPSKATFGTRGGGGGGGSNAVWNVSDLISDSESMSRSLLIGDEDDQVEDSSCGDLDNLMALFDSHIARERKSQIQHQQQRNNNSLYNFQQHRKVAQSPNAAEPPRLPIRAPPTPNQHLTKSEEQQQHQMSILSKQILSSSKLSIAPLGCGSPTLCVSGGLKLGGGNLGSSSTKKRSSATLRNALGSLAPGLGLPQDMSVKDRRSGLGGKQFGSTNCRPHNGLRGSASLSTLPSGFS